MGRKSKVDKEREALSIKRGTLSNLIFDAFPNVEAIDPDEFFSELSIYICSSCENVILMNAGECNVCSEWFCMDCKDEHAYEETGL